MAAGDHCLIVYLGMMVGAFLWGGLADRMGRRQCLIMSLSVKGLTVFAFFSSFVQGYGTFLFCRLLSGVGIGGSIPIVFSYFSEFLAQEKRGEHLSWLSMFWMIGGIYASAMAWAIIPHYGWSFQMGSAYQFHSWRVFVLVCAFPSVFAIGALNTMPESPRFYLENGKHDEAWMVLKQVHDTNMRAKGHPERVFSVTQIKFIKQEDELIEIQSDTGTWYRRWMIRILNLSQQVWSNFHQCFAPEYRRITLMMMAVWFTMSFSYYGLTVWFPDMIKHLQNIDYASRTKYFSNERVISFNFNFTLENQVHDNREYQNDKFIGLKLKSVIFENSLFKDCYFEDITSSNTFFKNCTFISTMFYNTDLFDYKFINSRIINSTFLHSKEGCQLDFSDDINNAYMIYFVSFLGTLAVLPGNIVSALLMDKIGRLRMLAGSSVMSCISCFFLFFGNSESAMIALLCLFGGVSIASWNALDVLTVELYPSDKRCHCSAANGIAGFELERKPTVSGPQTVTGRREVKMDADRAMISSILDEYRIGAGRTSLEDIYCLQHCIYGLTPFITYPRTVEERDQQRLIYCMRFLPSPIFKMERLMPTNREAQRKYLPFPLEEEDPEPTLMMASRLCEDLTVEKAKGEREEADTSRAQHDETTEKTSAKEQRMVKQKLDVKSKNLRRVQHQPGRRQKIRQPTTFQYVNTNLRGKKNILWTILFKPFCR
ncbi:synaptic vesicle glycoprotein 2A-like [Bufo gargarizans]|uniref:synaptic vesicle glycoprotein 2A-like n=1 Tax=Bufo gargarizans TaxID=30331 RepID=UPI001CF36852|nr:synaptic vesicle glycoprotein 2A-like [Bufo gargarizans]